MQRRITSSPGLEKLKKGGTTLLYVSHRLPEVFRLCNRITVLRDGGYVGTFDRDAATPERIVAAMVGRELPPRAARRPYAPANRCSRSGRSHDVPTSKTSRSA